MSDSVARTIFYHFKFVDEGGTVVVVVVGCSVGLGCRLLTHLLLAVPVDRSLCYFFQFSPPKSVLY